MNTVEDPLRQAVNGRHIRYAFQGSDPELSAFGHSLPRSRQCGGPVVPPRSDLTPQSNGCYAFSSSLSSRLADQMSARVASSARIILARIGIAVLLFGALVLLYCNEMTAPYNHDEEQFVFAGVLAQQMTSYKDFIYVQTPYYPIALSMVFSMIEEQYFYAARSLNRRRPISPI